MAGGKPALVAALMLLATACARPVLPEATSAQRIVSINPCVDAVLMAVADPEQIAAISHYSHDARSTSIPLDVARRFAATSGTAEEVVALAPDLVLAGAHVAPSTVEALRQMGIRLIQLEVPTSVAQSNAQVLAIAAAVGHPARGAELVSDIKARLAPATATGAAPQALIWQSGGLVPGKGTLADELMRISGLNNASADFGLKSWDVLPLEYLIGRPPALLLSSAAASQGDRMLGHPVMSDLARQITVADYPERLLSCAGPTIGAAVDRLRAARQAL